MHRILKQTEVATGNMLEPATLAVLDELYSGQCKRKAKKKPCKPKPAPAPQQQICLSPDVTELMSRIERLEVERKSASREFDEFRRKTNEEQKNIADTYEKRIVALQQNIDEWKKKYTEEADKNTELTLRIGELDEQLDEQKVNNAALGADISALKSEIEAIRKESDRQRRELIDEASDDKTLKDAVAKAESTARRSEQELATAKEQIASLKGEIETRKAQTAELEVELTQTATQLSDSNATNETLFTSIEQFNQFLARVQAEPVSIESSLPKFSKEQVAAIAGFMNSDAIFQSKREKSGSLFVEFFKIHLDASKKFGVAVAKGDRDALREVNKSATKKAADVVQRIQKFFPSGEQYANPMALLSKSFIALHEDLYVLMRKTKKQITAREIEDIVTEKEFPNNRKAADEFEKKFPGYGDLAKAVTKQLVSIFTGVTVLSESIRIANQDKFLDFQEVIEEPLLEITEDLVYFATSQINRLSVNLETAEKKRAQILRDAKQLGYQSYGAVTGDTEKSVVERAKKLNPFKEPAPSANVSTESSKSPFKNPSMGTNSKSQFTMKTINF